MRLEKMHIRDFRQFKDIIINYHDTLTILAGANNSGKTSLIELYNNMFKERENNLAVEDISIDRMKESSHIFFEEIYEIYIEKIKSKLDMDSFLNEINNSILRGDKLQTDFKLDTINVDFEIKYDKNKSIGAFSDYLMELGDNNCSFYFRYILEIDSIRFFKLLKMNYSIIIELLDNYKKNSNAKKIKKDWLDLFTSMCDSCLENKYYFCDKEYEILLSMTAKNFKDLFHYNYIGATRLLNDEKIDGHFSISKEMLSIFKLSSEWNELKDEMPKEFKTIIGDSEVYQKIETNSLKGLEDVLENISSTLDNNESSFFLDGDLNDEKLMSFLISIIQTYYRYSDGSTLKESSQGLGISNLIYMCLKLERFAKEYKPELVNLFVIEEPEAHMHPQMERILINHLNEDFKNKDIQGIVTTHSHEIVKASELETIRVIRKLELFESEIFDMYEFKNTLKDDEERNCFTFLFSINYSDLIFANKIIMYEGDTEKMYIEKLLTDQKYQFLSKQYISYVQVGGAYAHWYKKLIYFLGIKTLIFTDMDYGKKFIKIEDIITSKTTNSGLESYYKDDLIYKEIIKSVLPQCNDCKYESSLCFKNKSSYEQIFFARDKEICEHISIGCSINDIEKDKTSIKKLYEWTQQNKFVCVKSQNEKDRYSRTLEEAMFCKLLDITVEDVKKRDEWKAVREDTKLCFSIPSKQKEISVRDIIESSKDNKTDFMYSVILNNLQLKMIPNYFEEGLNWLGK